MTDDPVTADAKKPHRPPAVLRRSHCPRLPSALHEIVAAGWQELAASHFCPKHRR
jgi:hypothetical protein